MSNSPFHGSKQRIARAKVHVRDLKRRVQAFINRKPYRHVIQAHPDGLHQIHKLKARRKTLPVSFADFSTDAIENLRAALDYAVYSIAIKVGSPDLDKVYFPFCAKAGDFRSRITGCCPRFPKEILALLESFQPYEGGENTLWAINELCRISKHKTLAPIAFGLTAMHAHHIRGFGDFSLPPKYDPTNNEFILGTTRPDTYSAYNATLRFNIGFADIAVIINKPLVGILKEMISMVEGIVLGLEAESRRIKLFP